MEKEIVKLYMASHSPHIFQPTAGFLMLKQENRADVTFVKEQASGKEIVLPHGHCLVAYVAGKTIVFDMADGYNFADGFDFNKLLSKIDFYFKRSFSDEKNRIFVPDEFLRAKILPYGFNFYVPHRKIPLSAKEKLYNFLCCVKSSLISKRIITSVCKLNATEQAPKKVSNKPKIIFCARLWQDPQFSKEELDHINNMRIEIIRKLKNRYGENFVGGVSDSPLARTLCPDIILPKSVCDKAGYLKLMKQSDICIGSVGLHQSIGWKTGEYVAASKAIVCEEFCYSVTGDFKKGVNYLPYTTADECLKAVDHLYNNPSAIDEMAYANREYYINYGAPQKLIENALFSAGVQI